MRIATIVGARPQFVKAAAVSRAISGQETSLGYAAIDEVLIHTGQHYDASMSKVFFEELDIPVPDHNLEVGSGSHAEQTAKMLQRIEAVVVQARPQCLLVYGDTNSTVAGALCASKLGIPVAHVEAGMRSYNRAMPEELNRVVTDHLSDILYCSSSVSVQNLHKEGITNNVFQLGDVMYDCALYYRDKALLRKDQVLRKLGLRAGKYFLATIHRAGNVDDRQNLACDHGRIQPIGRHRVASGPPSAPPNQGSAVGVRHPGTVNRPACSSLSGTWTCWPFRPAPEASSPTPEAFKKKPISSAFHA